MVYFLDSRCILVVCSDGILLQVMSRRFTHNFSFTTEVMLNTLSEFEN